MVVYWRLSHTMADEFRIETHWKSLIRYDAPKIFDTDTGSQFTTPRFRNVHQRKREQPQAGGMPDEKGHDTSAATKRAKRPYP